MTYVKFTHDVMKTSKGTAQAIFDFVAFFVIRWACVYANYKTQPGWFEKNIRLQVSTRAARSPMTLSRLLALVTLSFKHQLSEHSTILQFKHHMSVYKVVLNFGTLLFLFSSFSDNQTVPKGVQFFINVFGLHRNPKYFSDPERYLPERFMREETTFRPPFVYIPFSGGARKCLGTHFI